MKQGKLYGIGVGPGDPELLTLKAARLLRACDEIAVPHKDPSRCLALQIARGALPELSEKPLLPVDMPMTKDPAALEAAYIAGTALLCARLDAGRQVAFLTLGDPTVYSTYSYLHRRVAALGYPTEIIPGVPSFCAAAAALNGPLCENRQELHIIPGTYHPAALDYPGVKVLMKNDLPRTLPEAKKRGLSAAMVENCGLPDQKIYPTLDQIPADAGYYSLLILRE